MTDETASGRHLSRRGALAVAGAGVVAATGVQLSAPQTATAARRVADVILVNGRVTTLDRRKPSVSALAVSGGRILATGSDFEVRRFAGRGTRVIDLRGRRVVPGLNDSHTHMIREGLVYTSELSLAGVTSVADALRLIKFQADRTPAPQWIRVVGSFTKWQFREQRLPTLAELNAAVPDKPVLLLHLYDRALLNQTAVRLLGITASTPAPPGGQIEVDAAGNPTGLLLAKPSPVILNATLARLPALDPESQVLSTRLYMRHLNARGVTSITDAAGGGTLYPDHYSVVNQLHAQGELTVRIGYHLYPRAPGTEFDNFREFVATQKVGGDGFLKMAGAGEVVVFDAVDFENFEEPRPNLPSTMDARLRDILALFAEHEWPFRLHSTYDESATRLLNNIEQVYGPTGPESGFIIDHGETLTDATIDRIAGLGGSIAVQHRMAFVGETFQQRYGARAAAHTPPVRRILHSGVPVGLGTDATRAASDNLWIALYWITTGRTLGGTRLYRSDNTLDRVEALRLLTQGSATLSKESKDKGTLAPGALADLAVLTEDYLRVPDSRIPGIESVLTMVDGRIVHAGAEFGKLNPPLPAVQPSYSPLLTGANRL
ncbi:amidohydrolase [Streptomyces sp. S3(2020)]|uniref:amidohydrolase n=1 Tax=Streptomyces sp. S3(2020) TaxID=2732044 RepID=UPI0014888E67|nr:amidohydrolase [Streptomyces sp. S3(2020)]NNN30619.1 amidohydrolase [Streptomyces sp. S3(2020)]